MGLVKETWSNPERLHAHPPSDRREHKLFSLPDNHVCRCGATEVPQLFSSHFSWGPTSLEQHSLGCVMRTVLGIITVNLPVLTGVNATLMRIQYKVWRSPKLLSVFQGGIHSDLHCRFLRSCSLMPGSHVFRGHLSGCLLYLTNA